MMQGVEYLAELKQKKQFDDHLNKKNKFSSVQFSFISAPPHNKNATII